MEDVEGDLTEDENDDGTKMGCVKVIDNVEFDFEDTAEDIPSGLRFQPLLGLVIAPTRELAVQVKHHIDAVAQFTGKNLISSFVLVSVRSISNSDNRCKLALWL